MSRCEPLTCGAVTQCDAVGLTNFSTRRQLADAMRAAHIEHELIEYPEAGHGFLSDRRASFHPQAAHDA